MASLMSKQHHDPLMMDLKELDFINNNESFSQGYDRVFSNQGMLCMPYVDGLMVKIVEPDFPPIREPPGCIMISVKFIGGME